MAFVGGRPTDIVSLFVSQSSLFERPVEVQVFDHCVVRVVDFESMANAGAGECFGDAARVPDEVGVGVCVGIDDRMTEVAAVVLEDEVLAVFQTNGIIAH